MANTTSFQNLLEKYRKISFSERDKGNRFERLMQAYLMTDPKYANRLKKVWLWDEFPGKNDLGGNDTGIDLVALSLEGDYWAIQCKCFKEDSVIDKPAIDSFLSTSSRQFKGEDLKTVRFSQRLWIDTTGKRWGSNAEEAIKNQHPPFLRLNLYSLIEAPVDWGKLDQGITGEPSRFTERELKKHQKEAVDKSHEHFKTIDRGKLIMACGTGKTFTSLRIAETETMDKGFILFLVPSIALLGQTLREWSTFSNKPINAICICSDPEITKKKTKNEDADTFSVVDLAAPASTNVKDILHQFSRLKNSKTIGMTVVFSTYQSIDVIAKAQKELSTFDKKYSEFDLIICDEAHRTTGVTLSGEDESSFTKVHDNKYLKAKKRLYMTATPRLYNDDSKSKAAQAEAILCSMDDPKLYGEEIYRIGFGEAVDLGLLTDYKVLILTLNEKDIPPAVQNIISNKESEINTDDASKLIGCVNALSKQILGDQGIIKDSDPEPMRRAVAFCQSIAVSKKITATFNTATDAYLGSLPPESKAQMVTVASNHIDGTMSAPYRDELLSWLKAGGEGNECRVLTNVRCLSEGVDVPTLDAVMFLSARNSQVDVVQSVGRVMRKAPGKNYGYIIIPVVVPADIEADKALNDNERYKVVWTVLNALRAHDDRFNAIVHKIELNKKRPGEILIGRPEYSFEDGIPMLAAEPGVEYKTDSLRSQLALQFEQLQNVIFARMVEKVGDKRYWEQWAKSVAQIAQRQTERITNLINEDTKHQKAFESFLKGLHKNINPSITQDEAIEMLSQHIITKPVFDALFENYSFVQNNPMSQSMQKMLSLLESDSFEKDAKDLEKFYEFVRMNVGNLDNAGAKQKIIIRLYDSFFKIAFPKMVEKLGIVYTPLEVVDFIIHSVAVILEKEFGRNISEENIHILDPFTGTGTFITRLLQSGLINSRDLARKYTQEIHCNEIVLLAYYIAAVNIENAYHDLLPNTTSYFTFEGICLTDTFQLGESKDGEKLFSEMFPQNSKRVQRQQKAPLRIILGNPPYSIGQKSANDNAQNQGYPILDQKISSTYSKESSAELNKSLHDAYIKAFRWSTDRLDPENGGIIAFITNSGWIDKPGMDGFRKCVVKDFSSIYTLNLRGGIRGLSGDAAKREGQNVFDIMTGVAITVMVKKPSANTTAEIHYADIGDYLSRKDKIRILNDAKSVLSDKIEWKTITPNEHGDWINHRSGSFETFTPLAPEKKFDPSTKSIFVTQGPGISTGRDAWVHNFSQTKLKENVRTLLNNYNSQLRSYITEFKKNPKIEIDKFINTDPTVISWTVNLKNDLKKNVTHEFDESAIQTTAYRPFCKQKIYFDNTLIERPGINGKIFPRTQSGNKTILLPGVGDRRGFAALIVNQLPNYDFLEKTQSFPQFYYEENEINSKTLFDDENNSSERLLKRDGISDYALDISRKIYGRQVQKEDLFYYVYGILHSIDYRMAFVNDLKKSSPRIPFVDDPKDFWKFSKAGRALAELHLNYETFPPLPEVHITGMDVGNYKPDKIRFVDKDKRDRICFNANIVISEIPQRAHDYVINGKSAIEWILDRYQKGTNKDSGIVNDPNDWSEEVGNPKYILNLLLSVINVSVQTVDIVNSLPKVKFE